MTHRRLIAYRVWRFHPPAHDPLLYSLNQMDWVPGTWAQAVCERFTPPPLYGTGGHSAPGEGCSCGFYAAKALVHSVDLARAAPTGLLVGRVELAGKVIEHDEGYRAERARIVELLPMPGQESVAEWFANVYGVPASHEVIDRWDTYPEPVIAKPVMAPRPRTPQGVPLARPRPAPAPSSSPRRKKGPVPGTRNLPMPRFTANRASVAIVGVLVALLAQAFLNLPPTTTTTTPVTLAPAAAPGYPGNLPGDICPNTNPLNCYVDQTAMLQQLSQTYGVKLSTITSPKTHHPRRVEAPSGPRPS